ncbi:MAG: RagB/SusD family nutrient uptake outer membrane protein, partial [Bacteroidota bacterium]
MNMKKYIVIILMCIMYSCDVLDQEPQSEITEDIIFLNQQGVDAAVLGLYSSLQANGLYGQNIPFATDQYADVTRFGGFFDTWLELDSKAIPTTNATGLAIWSNAYSTINLANILIERIPDVSDIGYTEDERDEDIAAAKAVRALCYFDLLRHFGEWWNDASIYGVPVIIASTGGDIVNIELKPRNTVGETWSQILNDLTDAEADLSSGGDRTLITQEFATGMLARYYLYTGDYANAIAKATSLIDNVDVSLAPVYAGAFSTGVNSEDILKLVFNQQDQSALSNLTVSREEVLPENDLISALEEDAGDSRRNLIGTVGTSSFNRVLKYPDGANGTDPALVMRLGEMYLIRAEAIIASGGDLDDALADLNTLRDRAGASDATYTDAADLTELYLDETMREMFAEGYRFFALVRLEQHDDVLGLEDFRRIFPIPQQELRIRDTPIVQNPGYQ